MNKGLVSCAVFAIAVSTLFFAPLTAQETGPSSKHGKSYTPPRTPWGDPDLQGNYTNKYEAEYAARTARRIRRTPR